MSESTSDENIEPSQSTDEEWTDPAVRLQELNGEDGSDENENDSIGLYYIFQAFLIPALIIGVVVSMFIGIRSLFTTGQSTKQLVSRITEGGGRGQWVAAAQLGKRLQTREDLLGKLRRNQGYKKRFRQEFEQTDNERLQVFLAQIMGLIKDTEAASYLENELRESTSDAVRVMILKSLGNIGNPSSEQVIGQYIDHDSPALRQAAVDAAGKFQKPEHIRLLVEQLDDPIPHVRLTTAIALSKYGPGPNVPIKRVVRILVDFMDRDLVSRQIKEADFQPPSLENNPMWGEPSKKGGERDTQQIDRLNHVNQMQTSSVVALRELISRHSSQMGFLKPKKSRVKILDQIRANLRSIIGTSQKTSRPLRREARNLLSILNVNQDE